MKRMIKINGAQFIVQKNNELYSLEKGYGVWAIIDLNNDNILNVEEINIAVEENTGENYNFTEEDIGIWVEQYRNKLFLFEDPVGYYFTFEEIENLKDKED